MEQTTRAGAAGQARIHRVGARLAKRVIEVHAVDAAGAVVCRLALTRDKLIAWRTRPPAGRTIAMEVSSGAHDHALGADRAGHIYGHVSTPDHFSPIGGAAKNLDWLSSDPQAPAVLDGTAEAE